MPTRKRARHNGEGSIRKRADGTWEARYTAGRNEQGQLVRRSVYGRTRAEVAQKLKDQLAQTPQGALVLTESGKLTLTDHLTAHVAGREGELSTGTVIKLRKYVQVVARFAVGGTPLRDLKPAHLEAFYRELAVQYAPATVRHINILIKRSLRQALRHELIARNPAEVAELPRMREERAGVQIEPAQLAVILREAQGHRLYPLFATVAALGLRHGEALGLQWGDLDLSGGTVEIRRAVVSRGGIPEVSLPKTTNSYRTLYLPDDLRQVLLGWRMALQGEGLPTLPGSWVFPSAVGGMLSQHNVRRVWKRILEAAEMPGETRIHDLRGAFLSRLIESGADPRTAADLAGHSDPRMTLKVYTYSRAERRKEALLTSTAGVLPPPTGTGEEVTPSTPTFTPTPPQRASADRRLGRGKS